MTTPTDTRHQLSSATGHAAEDTRIRSQRRRFAVAGLVALAAVMIAVVWAAAVLWPLTGQVDDLTRTDVPGDVVVTVEEPGNQVVYFERATWFASVPMNPDLTIEVIGPEGEALPTDTFDRPVHYRLPGLVGEPVATFDATAVGDYAVTVQADQPQPDDARIAIGTSITSGGLTSLAGHAIVLLVGLTASAAIAVRAARDRAT